MKVRNAIQALQEMTTPSSDGSKHYPAHSNPNITRLPHSGSNNAILARSSSHPPEMFYWEDPVVTRGPPCLTSIIDGTTQTETEELFYQYIIQNPRKVLAMLGLDPDRISSEFYRTSIRKSRTFPGDSVRSIASGKGDTKKADNRIKDNTVDIRELDSTLNLNDQSNASSHKNNKDESKTVYESVNIFPQANVLKFHRYNTMDT